MLSNFRAEKLKKSKWLLAKNLEVAIEKQKEFKNEESQPKSLWKRIKQFFGL